MNGDLRQQILVSLRAEGVGEADKAREAMAKLEERMRAAAKAFGECTMEGEDFRKTISSLGTSWNFFNQIVKESQKEIEAIDVGLHKLQVTAIKFADDYQASMAKAAAAGEAMELKEAERLAKLAADYEQFLTREETAAAATSAKKDELLAQEIAAELAAAEKKAAIAAKEVMEEEQRFNRMMRDRQEFLERQAKADADAEMKEAERQAKLAADHQKYLDRELAAEAAAAEKKDDLLAREVAAEIAAADK
jgi:chromosome segregation ATPase